MSTVSDKIVITEKGEITVGGDVSRQSIMDFEELLASMEGSFKGDNQEVCPLEHSFADNIYVRQITIPAGMFIVGKIHKHEHPNFLLKGEVIVVTEDGQETLTAPCSMISKSGTKRALYAITDLVWTTIHHNPTNTTDVAELEQQIIAKSYEEYDKFVESKGGIIPRLKRNLIKLLSK